MPTLEIDAVCAVCGRHLKSTFNYRNLEIQAEPCETCLEEKYEEGYDRGREEGLEEGK